MYKVFINHAELRFTKTPSSGATQTLSYHDAFNWKTLYQQLKTINTTMICNVTHNQPEESFADFCRAFSIIDAAGGLVKNTLGEVLMIHRLGKWDLPKGKMEAGESPPNTALREVEEECGIRKLTIQDTTPFTTYHTYEINGQRKLKRTWWYAMKSEWTKALVPQTEEGISKVEWVPEGDALNSKLRNTFENIREVIKELI